MDLASFNSAPSETATSVVRPCADIAWWADSIVGRRPYDSVAELLSTADQLSHDWGEPDVKSALAQHPRIGERHSGSSTEAALSANEQSGVQAALDAELASELRQANQAYEERFNQVFLIRAAGRSATQILAELQRRLGNSAAQERVETATQLRQIAVLRLQQAVTGQSR